MSSKLRYRLLISLLIIASLVLGACGGGNQAEAPAEMPVAEEVTTVEESPAAEEVAEEAAPAFDMAAYVADYLASIPEGWMAMGDIDTFKEAMDTGEVALIDVRTAAEYEAGHIPGAVNVPIRTLTDNLDAIPADQPVFVYCASGHRAAMATSALRMLGYDNAKSFPPGWKGWTAAEEVVSTDAVAPGSYGVPAIEPELLASVDEFVNNIPEGFLALGDMEKLNGALDAGAVLIDVREPSEFDAGAITGAVNIPIRTLGENFEAIPADLPVVLYCGSGHRAAVAMAALQSMGYENVRTFPPSYKGWVAATAEAAPAAEFDVVAAVDEYLSNIPEGWMAVGKVDAFKEIMEATDPYIIDVREAAEYEAGHLPGAVNIPIRTLAANLDAIPTDQPVFVYCASGHRAALSLSALRMLGYDNVKVFAPGWKGWESAGEPASTEMVAAGSFDTPEIDPALLAAVDGYLSGIPEGFYSLGGVDQMNGALDAGVFALDVRQPEEYAAGYIPTAVNVPLRELAGNLDALPQDAPIAVYCGSGHRAALATTALHMMGYDNVRSFPASYRGWTAAEQPVESLQ